MTFEWQRFWWDVPVGWHWICSFSELSSVLRLTHICMAFWLTSACEPSWAETVIRPECEVALKASLEFICMQDCWVESKRGNVSQMITGTNPYWLPTSQRHDLRLLGYHEEQKRGKEKKNAWNFILFFYFLYKQLENYKKKVNKNVGHPLNCPSLLMFCRLPHPPSCCSETRCCGSD